MSGFVPAERNEARAASPQEVTRLKWIRAVGDAYSFAGHIFHDHSILAIAVTPVISLEAAIDAGSPPATRRLKYTLSYGCIAAMSRTVTLRRTAAATTAARTDRGTASGGTLERRGGERPPAAGITNNKMRTGVIKRGSAAAIAVSSGENERRSEEGDRHGALTISAVVGAVRCTASGRNPRPARRDRFPATAGEPRRTYATGAGARHLWPKNSVDPVNENRAALRIPTVD
jgi:hypothetical protein